MVWIIQSEVAKYISSASQVLLSFIINLVVAAIKLEAHSPIKSQ
jgi:hypothetical protein